MTDLDKLGLTSQDFDPDIKPSPLANGAAAPPLEPPKPAEPAAPPEPKPDAEVAVTFLQHLYPAGPWALTAIIPDGGALTKTFVPGMERELRAFIEQYDNIYYHVNEPNRRISSKATKEDIKCAHFVHLDIDPLDGESPDACKARALAALKGEPEPTAVVDSGNGIQVLWRLTTPVADIATIEARNKGIIAKLGGDVGTGNIDRILRLPGTTNIPNAKKREKGRVPCLAKLIMQTAASHPLATFPAAASPAKKPGTPEDGGHHARQGVGLDDLDLCLLSTSEQDELRTLIRDGRTADKDFGGDRSAAAFHVVCRLRGVGVPDDVILAILLNRDYRISDHNYDQRDPERAARRTLEKAQQEEPAPLPMIRIVDGEIDRIVREAEAKLIAAEVPLLVRAGKLVEPITDELPTTGGRKTDVTVLRAVNPDKIALLLNGQAATFIRYDGRRKKWVPTDPPADVARKLWNKGDWQFHKVSGVITAPTLRPDGSILSEPGYDPATKLWYAPDGKLTLPPMKEKPSRADAEAALEALADLLTEFPFVNPTDRSVALAAILTVVLRGACDVVPMLLFRAHTPATGKSYLADLVSRIVQGRPCPVITASKSPEEMEKRLGALVLEGLPMVSLDNASHDLGGDLLCQITERRVIRVRILGKSEVPESEWSGTLFATGNNIRVLGDMNRRTLVCNLDAGVERPELREFKGDPVKQILADRGRYIAAAITIARAYLASGEPVNRPIASYGQWSRVAREPLVWLGCADPVKSMDELRDADPEGEAERELIAHWREYLKPNQGYTANQLKAEATRPGPDGPERPEFRDLLLLQAGRGEIIEPRRVGNWLMRIQGRIHDGYKISLVSKSASNGNRYALVDVSQPRLALGDE